MNKLIPMLKKKSYEIRKSMLEMCIKAETGHVTSSLSCIDILVALYYGNILNHMPQDPSCDKRDRFILSKGQASPALYAILADAGYYKKSELDKFAQKGGMFGVHLQNDVPGVEITSGSLGLGLGIAAGIALGAKMDRALYLVFALLGDGECYEGSIWETAMFASHNRLNNLIAIIDRNYLCVTDFTENLIALEPIEDKWKSFGWDTQRIDGHSFEDILSALSNLRSRRSLKPLVIIADTTKGEGVEHVSNNPLWHGLAPKGKDAEFARQCLNRRYANE
ncbi:MAG: transketolase [Candidatus Kuenenia sp.]|nr:transketolase [Candidatus Kuenenia hertensis]